MKLSCTWGALFDYARLPFVLHAGYIIVSRLSSDIYAALPTRAPQPLDLSSPDEGLALNLTQLIELSPENPDLLYKRARVYFNGRKFDLSEQDVNAVIKLSNDTLASNAWLLKSKIYTVRGDWSTSRRVLEEDPSRFGELETQVSKQLNVIDRLEERLRAAKLSKSERYFTGCLRYTRNLADHVPHSRAVLSLHASCAFEALRLEEARVAYAALSGLSDATVVDLVIAARFTYLFTEPDGSKISPGLRGCLMRTQKSSKCLSLAERIKKFNSIVRFAVMLQTWDWRGLVSVLVHGSANTMTPDRLLSTCDARLLRSRSTTSRDVKKLSKRWILLARTLCTWAEKLDSDTVETNTLCRALGHKQHSIRSPRKSVPA